MIGETDKIKHTIKKELKEFEFYYKKAIQSDIPLLGTILNFLYRTKGKQLRPVFVFLSASLHGEPNEFSQLAACSVELLHSATLIHDDVVDESYERRGAFSINALWRNKLAVLVGDYILAKGLILQLENKKYNFLHLISRAVQEMSEGEILQVKKSRQLDIDEETYFEIIRKKTASLIATSMAIGTASVTDDEDLYLKMYKIGQDAGIAFQIKDDIFDYQKRGIIGKPTGNDIKEKKITLPLLYVIKNSDPAERRRILRLIKNKNKNPAVVQEIIRMVKGKGGLDYATKKMNEFRDNAIKGLMEYPESEARESLIELMNYITTREK
jgi:octaprenyl-diphosphate synthase